MKALATGRMSEFLNPLKEATKRRLRTVCHVLCQSIVATGIRHVEGLLHWVGHDGRLVGPCTGNSQHRYIS